MLKTLRYSPLFAAITVAGLAFSMPANAACWSGKVAGLEYADLEKSRDEAGRYGGLAVSAEGSGVRLRVLDSDLVTLCKESSSATRCDYLDDMSAQHYNIRIDNSANSEEITYNLCTF